MKTKTILFACYGGGHVQSLIPIIHELRTDESINLIVVGFTTALATFERSGIDARGYSVLEKYIEQPCPDIVNQFIGEVGHPDVKAEDTYAYFHIGIHDLVSDVGCISAIKMLKQQGRAAFMPIKTFTHYLQDIKPDLVVTSTSPRSELALQRAARKLNIPGLAVSDLFLQHEAAYLCDGTYAENITVISKYVADYLRKSLCDRISLHVTGNPAFDAMFAKCEKVTGGRIRKKYAVKPTDRLITWIGTPSDVSLTGKKFVKNRVIIKYLEDFCIKNAGYLFAFRPHPNRPIELPHTVEKGFLLGSQYSIESVLWASDIVVLETSTVGLQAALINKVVITIAAEDYPPYKQLGLSTDVSDVDGLGRAFLNMKQPNLDYFEANNGKATQSVLKVINQIGMNK